MIKDASALSVDQIAILLGLNVSDLKIKGRKQIYTTPIGCIYLRRSRNFGFSHKNWWYSIDPAVVVDEKIDFLVLAADYLGAFLIPAISFLQYRDHNSVGKVKDDREDFTIVQEGNSFIRREAKCIDWDITKYFIKSDNVL